MKTLIIAISMITSAMFAQSTQTDPGTRTIRETGSRNAATQDTTADQAQNTPSDKTRKKSKPRRQQAKTKATTPNGRRESTESK
jgi:hypothetical protein